MNINATFLSMQNKKRMIKNKEKELGDAQIHPCSF